jgi:hypothetical protein
MLRGVAICGDFTRDKCTLNISDPIVSFNNLSSSPMQKIAMAPNKWPTYLKYLLEARYPNPQVRSGSVYLMLFATASIVLQVTGLGGNAARLHASIAHKSWLDQNSIIGHPGGEMTIRNSTCGRTYRVSILQGRSFYQVLCQCPEKAGFHSKDKSTIVCVVMSMCGYGIPEHLYE